MISQYLQSLEGIAVLGIGSLAVSFALFVGIVIWAIRADAGYIKTMEQLPLDHPTPSSEEVQQ
jgi:hypothetical protein